MLNAHMEEYLPELAMIKTEEIVARDDGLAPEKVKAEALCSLSLNVAQAATEFFKMRAKKPSKRTRGKILMNLLEVCKWASAMLLFHGLDPVQQDEIQEFAKEYDPEFQNDAVLCCLSMQGNISELADIVFADRDIEESLSVDDEAELEQHIAELLAMSCICASLLNCSFEDLLTGAFF